MFSISDNTIVELKRENFKSFPEVEEKLRRNYLPKCITENDKEFKMLKSSGLKEWSRENCFFDNFKEFYDNCSFIKWDGYKNSLNNVTKNGIFYLHVICFIFLAFKYKKICSKNIYLQSLWVTFI